MKMVTKQVSIIPGNGDRAIVIGATGSGKSTASMWLMRRSPKVPIVIYDVKHEDMFFDLPKVAAAFSWEGVKSLLDDGETDYVLFRPPNNELGNANVLDEYLMRHLEELSDIPAHIDELYAFHNKGHAGNGLIALLTRGRSRGITTTMATQRPAFISLFSLTEAQHLFVFRLTHTDDKKRVAKIIPDYDRVPEPAEYGFHHYNIRERVLREFKPLVPDKKPLAPMHEKGNTVSPLAVGLGDGLTWI